MISFILWTIGGFIIGAIIGGVLGNIFGEVVSFIDDLIGLIPISRFLTRLIIIPGTCALVYFLCDETYWFGIIVAWWAFYLYCIHYAEEAGGGPDDD